MYSDGAKTSSPATQPPAPDADEVAYFDNDLLLSRVAARDTDPEDLAEEFGIRLGLFLDWLSAPQTVKRLNALIQARAINLQHEHQTHRDNSLDELLALQKQAKKSSAEDAHIERRRLAVAVLQFTSRATPALRLFGEAGRAADTHRAGSVGSSGLSLSRIPAQYRTRSRQVRTVPILHEAPAILRGPDLPDPALAPAEVTIKVLHRLQDSDNPTNGDGLRTLFNHFTPNWRECVQAATADDFACTTYGAYHLLLAHHSAVLHGTVFPGGQSPEAPALQAQQNADFIDLNGTHRRLELQFTRQSPDGPWLIDDLQLTPVPPPSRDPPAPTLTPTPDPAPTATPEPRPPPNDPAPADPAP